jgi:hypothetical protein
MGLGMKKVVALDAARLVDQDAQRVWPAKVSPRGCAALRALRALIAAASTAAQNQ